MDNELLLFDRIEIIKATNQKYDLENNAYISFSGGKDSTILHYLIDLALPNNKIPRVFINTGIEYLDIVKFVKELANKDERFVFIRPTKPIKKVLEEFGYPFKSKQHAHNVAIYQNSGMTITNQKYLGLDTKTKFLCPEILKYQFSDDFKIKISDKCCYKLKKEPAKLWAEQNKKTITMTGMRSEEGGMRNYQKDCAIFDGNDLVKFHPLKPITNEFAEWFIEKYNIDLCVLYKPPFNFKRTGCKGCPFSLDLQQQIDFMSIWRERERVQCENIWKPIYDEYRRIGYRLRKEERKYNLFDYVKENNDD